MINAAQRSYSLLVITLLVGWLTACGSPAPEQENPATQPPPPISTSVSQAEPVQDLIVVIATEEPTAIPPTGEGAVDAARTPIPTATLPAGLQETPTPAPTATIEEPKSPPGIVLDSPSAGQQYVSGTAISISGNASGVEPGHTVVVSLQEAAAGRVADVRLVAQEGTWRALLSIPAETTGAMIVDASLLDAQGNLVAQATTPVEIVGSTIVEDPNAPLKIDYISPLVVAGKGLHLRGTATSDQQRFTVNMGVYYNECTETAGLVSFDLYASGDWLAYLTVPEFAVGPICIIATLSSPANGEEARTQVNLEAIDRTDEAAIGLVIANPQPGWDVNPPIRVDGIAYNPPGGVINVSARLPDGTILWDVVVAPDGFGYWQANLPIGEGFYNAEVVAWMGDPNEPIYISHPVRVLGPQNQPPAEEEADSAETDS